MINKNKVKMRRVRKTIKTVRNSKKSFKKQVMQCIGSALVSFCFLFRKNTLLILKLGFRVRQIG